MSAKTRVLVVDDHAVVRSGIRSLLGAEPDFEVVGEASNARDAAHTAGPSQCASVSFKAADIHARRSSGVFTRFADVAASRPSECENAPTGKRLSHTCSRVTRLAIIARARDDERGRAPPQ